MSFSGLANWSLIAPKQSMPADVLPNHAWLLLDTSLPPVRVDTGSMSPDPRIVREPMPGPVSIAPSQVAAACAQHELGGVSLLGRRRAGRPGCRRPSPGGRPPSDSASRRCPASAAGSAPVRPSDRVTCTASRSPPDDRAAHPPGAPDQRVALRAAGERDDLCFLASQVARMPCAAR